MRSPFFRSSVSLLVSAAVIAGSVGPAYSQNYDEGVAPTRGGYDAEGGQFEIPDPVYPPVEYQEPFEIPDPVYPPPDDPTVGQYNAPWDPNPTGKAACDIAQDFIKGKLMDVVAELPGGAVVKIGNDFVLDPIIAAATTEGEDGQQAGALIGTLLQNGAQLVVPELGLATLGGKIIIAGTEFTIQQAVAAVRDEEVEAFLTGYGGPLGSVGNIGAQVPFLPFVRNRHYRPDDGGLPVYPYQHMTSDDLGLFFQDEQQLSENWALWVNNHDFIGRRNLRPIEALAWPRIQAMWRAQRLAIMVANLERAIRNVLASAERDLQAGGGGSCVNNTGGGVLASAARQVTGAPNPWQGLYTGVIDTPVTFEWDTRIRVHGIVCFGGGQTALYFDHYHLNGQFVGADQREYYRVRNPAAAGGSFCGEWETRRETTGKGAGGNQGAPDDSYHPSNKL